MRFSQHSDTKRIKSLFFNITKSMLRCMYQGGKDILHNQEDMSLNHTLILTYTMPGQITYIKLLDNPWYAADTKLMLVLQHLYLCPLFLLFTSLFILLSLEIAGVGGMNWEIGIDIYTLLILCIKQITNENLLYSTGNSTQCSVVTECEGNPKKKRYMYTYS